MTQTVMVIDDEIEILDMLKQYFSLEGYHVITAAGGKEALQKLGKQPDIILLDINMPDIDGFSLCKSIRDFQGPGIQEMTVVHFAFVYFPGAVILVPAGIKDVNFIVPDIFLQVVKEVYTVG